jgi:hypothetical protein
MPCEPTQGTHYLSIGQIIGHLEHSYIPIFDHSLAYPRTFTISIFLEWSVTPIIPGSQYWMLCWPTQGTHHLSIDWLICHVDHSCIPIFDRSLAYPTHSPFQYSLNDRLLRLFQVLNIRCHVSRLKALTIWVLVKSLVTSNIPIFQYLITR